MFQWLLLGFQEQQKQLTFLLLPRALTNKSGSEYRLSIGVKYFFKVFGFFFNLKKLKEIPQSCFTKLVMNSLTSKSISFEKKGLQVRTLEWILIYSFTLVNPTGVGIWCKTAVFTSEKCEKKSTWNSLHMHYVLSLDKRKRVTCLFCRVVFTRKEKE